MSYFLRVNHDEFLNMDHVVSVTEDHNATEDGHQWYFVEMDDGNRRRVRFYDTTPNDDVENVLTTVTIPAHDLRAVVITVYYSTDKCPTMEDVVIERIPILGWRDSGSFRAPIFIQDLCSNQRPFLDQHGMVSLEYDGISYSNSEEAKEGVLDEAISDWNRKHG